MSDKKDLLTFRGDTLHSAKRNRGKDTMSCSVTIDYYGKVVTYTVVLTGYNHFDLRYRGDLQLITMFCREHIVREFLTPGRK